jgi:hypothetical protein
MKKNTLIATGAALLMSLVLLPGCVQMPTEKQSVSDMRPQISFRTTDTQMHAARVIVDGLDMGTVGAFLKGQAALRIQPGTHQLRVVLGSQQLLDEKFFVDDGVSRTFSVR